MDLLKVIGIGLHEGCRYLWNRKFDTESFWMRCIRVNIIYAKFFQAIAVKYNLHTAVHSIPYTAEEIDYPENINLHGIIGSGLISIVFEGTYEGVPIVIKTKRKGIESRVRQGLDALNRWITRINYVYPYSILTTSYQEISDSFYLQMDFENEMKNHRRFKKMFESNSEIRIPILVDELCSSKQIVMTKLEGVPIASLGEVQKQKSVERLTEVIVETIMSHGFLHADLHSGNLIFHEDYLGILDFGFMIDLTSKEQEHLVALLRDIALGDYTGAATNVVGFIENNNKLSDVELKDIHDYVVHNCQCVLEVDHCFSVCSISRMSKKIQKYKLRFSPVLYKVAVALGAVEVVTTELSSTSTDIFVNAIVAMLSK